MNVHYDHLLRRLLSINKQSAKKLGLNNSLALNEALGKPAFAFPTIHIAGTNGKGSVATKIAAALQASRLRVGLYTSPHIACFRERMRINGQMINERQAEQHLGRTFLAMDAHEIPATFFELTTLMAFAYFYEEDVDIAVIETGLGGRFDATNIIHPKLSIITSISFDHTEILGNSLEEIAREKAGIIKPRVPVVIGPRVPRAVIEETAKRVNSPCIQVEGSFGDFHEENEAIAERALRELDVPQKSILRGIKALPPCRLETLYPFQLRNRFQTEDLPEAIVLDVAHNPDGLNHLMKGIDRRFKQQGKRLIIGLSKNKDLHACLKTLHSYATHFHLVEAENERAASTESLKDILLTLGVSSDKISCESSVEVALHSALRLAAKNREIAIICGTFFIMGAARKVLGIEEPQDPEDLNERHFPSSMNDSHRVLKVNHLT